MTIENNNKMPKDIPEAKAIIKTNKISPVWVIPIIAAFIGAWLVFQEATEENIFVEVSFKSASGLEAKKTLVKLRNVKVGEVREVKFSADLSKVQVLMELTGVAIERLTDTTRFWVVRPRVGVEGVSGLDTLLSGAYIEIDPGKGGNPQTYFQGLEEPQIYQLGNPGTKYILNSSQLGSLSRGSSIKYRGITVGSVTKYKLVEDHSYVEIEIFINAPHDQVVTEQSRFWNISGVNLELDAKGFDFNMESISSLVAGGVAFTNDNISGEFIQAKENKEFILYKTKEPEAEERLTFGVPMKLYFENGVSGLSIGAAVEYKGLRIGTVVKVGVEQNTDKNDILTFAIIDVEPERLPANARNTKLSREERVKTIYSYFEHMVKSGMRGQLKSNILTGQSLVVLDLFHNIEKQSVKRVDGDFILPTVPETVSGLVKQINLLLARLELLPLENIGKNLDEVTANANDLIKSLNAEEGGMTGVQLNEAMDELTKAARSIRAMSEYLERHPEAIIKGKRPE